MPNNGITFVAIVALTAPPAIGAEIIPESRDSKLMITTANLGFTQGFTGDGIDPIDLTETGLTSADDLFSQAQLYYGPDGFGRINSGEFDAYQDVTLEPTQLIFDFYSYSSVSGDASPLCTIDNDMFFYFSVDEDTTATLSVSYTGDTNVGNDRVGLQLREVGPGSDPVILDDLFLLGAFPDGPNSVEIDVTLEAGKRYRFFVDAHARSLATVGAQTAEIVATLALPCTADLAEPFGQLTFADISAFLAAFTTNDPAADLAEPFGQLTFADISAFLAAFTAGCP